MMLDHYQQTKNMLVSYQPRQARLFLNGKLRRGGAEIAKDGGTADQAGY